MFGKFNLVITSILLFFGFTSQIHAQNTKNFNNQIKGGEVGQTIAFVGKKIGLQNVENHCPKDMICLDSRYNARYRIDELLVGEHEDATIDFIVYDHYGTPKFSKHDRVVIYVSQTEDGYVHHKYAYDILNPTKSKKYAFCGDPYADYDAAAIEKHGRIDLEAFEFSPSVKVKLQNHFLNEEDMKGMSQTNIREDFLESVRQISQPAFHIKGGKAICKMGMTALNVANVRMQYEYGPQKKN